MPIQPRFTKRLMREVENSKNCNDPFVAFTPVSDNLQTWHFTVRGPDDTPFENGVFHGLLELHDDYPMQAPKFEMLMDNGKYRPNTRICLNMTDYHADTWQPATTIEAMVRMIQAFFEDPSTSGIGFISPRPSDAELRRIAANSVNYTCPKCGKIINQLAPHTK